MRRAKVSPLYLVTRLGFSALVICIFSSGFLPPISQAQAQTVNLTAPAQAQTKAEVNPANLFLNLKATNLNTGAASSSFPIPDLQSFATQAAAQAPQPRKVPAVTDPHLPSLIFKVEVGPEQLVVGESATVTLTVTNQAPDPASELVISLALPEGTRAVAGPGFISDKQGWKWTQPGLAAQSSTSVTATLELIKLPTGEALLARAQLTAKGLSQPMFRTGGAIVEAKAAGVASSTFTPGTQAELKSEDGRIEVKLPANAYKGTLALQHLPGKLKLSSLKKLPGALVPPEQAGFYRGFETFFLEAAEGNAKQVHKFDQPITITHHYTPQQLLALGRSEADLTLFWFDESKTEKLSNGKNRQGQWLPIPTQIDPVKHTATATVDHFSAYQLGDGSSISSNFIPSVQGWQEDMFTGSTSYNYPIELPAGPGGIKPDLKLSYNSAATDGRSGVRGLNQAGWVGRGWGLETGSIAEYKTGPDFAPYRNFSLILNGQAFDLSKAEALVGNPGNDLRNYAWRSVDESFLKVRVISNGNTPYNNPRLLWQVWGKNGVRYDFSEDAWWGFTNCDVNTKEPYRWQLKSVTDPHGNTITYSYDRLTGTDTSCGVTETLTYDIWPTTITWGANATTGATDRYKVDFITSARTDDTSADSSSVQIGAIRQTRQLDALKVSSRQATNWELVRQYNFSYDYSTYADNTVDWGSGRQANTDYPKLTLKTITRLGNDGATALPSLNFSYGSRGTADYPQGGWNRITGMDNGQGGTMALSYDNIGYYLNSHGINTNLFNNNNRVTAKTLTNSAATGGQSYTWTYAYGTPNYNSLGTLNGYGGTQPYPNSARLYVNENQGSPSENYSISVHPAYTEFRGHDYSIETDPSGTNTKHWFFQGDSPCGDPLTTGTNCFVDIRNREFVKGREYKTEIRAADSTLMRQSDYEWGVEFDDPVAYSASGSIHTGLWRNFSYMSQRTDRAYDAPNSSGLNKTTKYFYALTDPITGVSTQSDNTKHGNITRQEEYDQNNNLYRYTVYFYSTLNIDTNLVDRLRGWQVRDGQNRNLAITGYF